MIDLHVKQFDGGSSTACDGRNCAAASCAMAIHAGTGGTVTLSSDDVRRLSGASCVPGVHTPSGGLTTTDVERVGRLFSVDIDYGNPLTRWAWTEAKTRLSDKYVGIFLGDYDQVPSPYRTGTFQGDHSLLAHDYRTDLPPFGGTSPTGTVCWHDPLRSYAIRVPLPILLRYWQKDGSPVKGFAGWVKDTRKPAYGLAFTPGPFWVYTVKLGVITGRTTKEFASATSAPCEAPKIVKWPLRLTSRNLALVTAGALAGKYVAIPQTHVTLYER